MTATKSEAQEQGVIREAVSPDPHSAASSLKLWWIPQVPMKRFEVFVKDLPEGVKLLQVLAAYDSFQYENKVKPDYCNAGGLMMLDQDGDWVDWYDEETGADDPEDFLANGAT